MKKLRALIFPFAALAFSVNAHAAPVQYQITATHTQETANGTPIDASDYLFADGTTVTATFDYDPTAPVFIDNHSLGATGRYSTYQASISTSITIGEYAISTMSGLAVVDDYETPDTPYTDTVLLIAGTSNNAFSPVNFGSFTVYGARFIIGGLNDMLSDTSLPNSLTGLNSNFVGFILEYSGENSAHRLATFENGTISQVPLPSSALFFLSGLIGLGANIFRKAKK